MKSLVLAFLLSPALALAADFSMASGKVLIAAPTALNGPSNQGVWFVDPMTHAFTLNLPEPDQGYVYEAFIFNEATGAKHTTGLFRAMGGSDSDAAGPFAGMLKLNSPAQPGSDFVLLNENIVDGAHDILVAVVPYPMTSELQQAQEILKVRIPAGAGVGTQLDLQNVSH